MEIEVASRTRIPAPAAHGKPPHPAAPQTTLMNSRRFTAKYLPCLNGRDSISRYCCAAGFRSGPCLLGVRPGHSAMSAQCPHCSKAGVKPALLRCPKSAITGQTLLFNHLVARASSVLGTSRPSVFAVFRLVTSSYLVGACARPFELCLLLRRCVTDNQWLIGIIATDRTRSPERN